MRVLALVALSLVVTAAAAAQLPGWVERRHPDFGWRISHPAHFKAADFATLGMATWRGTTLANIEPPGFWKRAKLPADAVIVHVFHLAGGPAGPLYKSRDSRFPLSLDRSVRMAGRWRRLPFQAGGIEFEALIWIGPTAPRRDRDAARGILRSFRPRPLRTGSVSGCSFYVLDYAKAHRVGSVRRYEPRQLPKADCVRPAPFYLVRASTGFYTVSWHSSLKDGYKHCSVRFDPRRRGFFCPNGARWDLRGNVRRNPNPGRFQDDPLDMHPAVIAFDGHVLASP